MFKKENIGKQLHIEDLDYLLIDQINRQFGKYGNILGLCIQRFSVDILYRNAKKAQGALQKGKHFYGKVLKISVNDEKSVKPEPEPPHRIVFLPRCDIIPKIEKLEIEEPSGNHNDSQNEQDSSNSINNLSESQIDNPIIPQNEQSQMETLAELEVDIKPNIDQQAEIMEIKKERGPEIKTTVSVRDIFSSHLDKLGPECNRIFLGNLQIIIRTLLQNHFKKYGVVRFLRVGKCVASIQYENKDQADAACKAGSHSTILGGTFYLKRSCYRRNEELPPDRQNILECIHGTKRKFEGSDPQTSKRCRVGNNECQIIVLSNTDVAKSKFDPIKVRLKEFGLNADVLFLNENTSISTVINKECISIQIEPIDEQAWNMKVVHGKSRKVYRRMQVEDVPMFVIRNYIHNLRTELVSKQECSTQTQKSNELQNEIETSTNQEIQIPGDIPEDNVEDLKNKIVQLEKTIENLNVQLALSHEKCSEFKINGENLKNENLNLKESLELKEEELKENNKLIQDLQNNALRLKAESHSRKNNR